MAKLFKTTDLLLVVSAVTVAILAGLLVLAAAHDPQIRLALPIFFVGMVGGGLLLFRQWRKAHGSLIASKARARYRATHDDLTQLPNRVLLLERIGEVLGERRDGASAVLCIALGRLREIEDSFGDAVADQVTLQVAERLRDACRDADTIARLASDEFAILWRGVEPQRVETLAQALRDLTSGGVDTTRGRLLLVTTVGVSLGDAAEGSATEVLRRARLAMAFAKRTDTQVRLFSPEMDHDLRDRTAMEAELHEAVAAGQIRMVYQPQSNGRGVMTGRLRPEAELHRRETLARLEDRDQCLDPGNSLRSPVRAAEDAAARDRRDPKPVRAGDHRGRLAPRHRRGLQDPRRDPPARLQDRLG
jgi:diguanylate cyclase (GGDEF)-like protein